MTHWKITTEYSDGDKYIQFGTDDSDAKTRIGYMIQNNSTRIRRMTITPQREMSKDAS